MLSKLKIQKRLIVSFMVVALMVGLSGILGITLFAKADADYSRALENYGFASGKLGMLSSEINFNRAYIRDIVFLKDPAQLKAANAEIQASIDRVNVLLNEVRRTTTSDAGKKLFNQIESEIMEYRVVRDQVLEMGMANRDVESNALWTNKANPMITKISEDINALYQMNVDVGNDVSADLTRFGQVMLIFMAVCIAAGFVAAIILAVYIARGIAKPLAEIDDCAKKIAVGDFDVHIDYQSRDEIGSLANSMRQMMDNTNAIITDTVRGLGEIADSNFDIAPQVAYIGAFKGIETAINRIIRDLSETMLQIRVASEQVSSGSNQVSGGAQALAQGATEQASTVQQLSASMSEVSAQIKENATNAATASGVANDVGGTIDTSNQQMNEMMGAMSEISRSSAEISKIIKTIEDIAFQTNILALNAAVEAARAGAAGKGFAVVADEVRNLATKSSQAAKQTNELIESSVHSVENGVKIANETAQSLEKVVAGADEIMSFITKISQSSTEQASSIAQINLGIEQISSVVQTNSATSQQSAAASEELNSQANMMKQLVSKFKLKTDASVFAAPITRFSNEEEYVGLAPANGAKYG